MNSSEDSSDDSNWVSTLLQTQYGEYLCKVDDEYLKDKFNLTYLEREVQNFKRAYVILLGYSLDHEFQEEAVMLYGLIHARYILTPTGMSKIYSKYRDGVFGTCPRVLCSNSLLLPIGLTDKPRTHSLKLFCPKCCDLYTPKSRKALNVDGAWFGTSFPHFLLHSYKESSGNLGQSKACYTPKIFGFKLAN